MSHLMDGWMDGCEMDGFELWWHVLNKRTMDG